jgi:hypothetical protein
MKVTEQEIDSEDSEDEELSDIDETHMKTDSGV